MPAGADPSRLGSEQLEHAVEPGAGVCLPLALRAGPLEDSLEAGEGRLVADLGCVRRRQRGGAILCTSPMPLAYPTGCHSDVVGLGGTAT